MAGSRGDNEGRYVAISTRLWNRPPFRALDITQQHLYLYLATHPQQNALGCYVISIAETAERCGTAKAIDARIREVQRGLNLLLTQNLIGFDARNSCVRIVNHLADNPIRNENCVKACMKILPELPPSPLLADVARELSQDPPKHLFTLISALQEACGIDIQAVVQPELPWSNSTKNAEPLPQPLPEPFTERFAEPLPKPLPQRLGKQIGEPVPVPVPLVSNIDTGSNSVPEAGSEGKPPPGTEGRYPRLSRLRDEVGRYSPRDLLDGTTGADALYAAAEATLTDLEAVSPTWQADVTAILRRPRECQELKTSPCPAVIVGKAARWALDNVRERKVERHGTLSDRARQLLDDEDRRTGGDIERTVSEAAVE